MTQLHATAVALNEAGILIRGPAGSGKSDLALRLLDGGWDLIADDRVELTPVGTKLHLSAPVTIRGLIEVRGLGVINIGAVQDVPLHLIIELIPRDKTQRMPDIKAEKIDGITIPVVEIDGFEISAPAKVKMALRIQQGEVTLVE